jgi:drug/metabolite transporter (DMT)-like permease
VLRAAWHSIRRPDWSGVCRIILGGMNLTADTGQRQVEIGSLYGLGAAVLFGASTPISKLLLPSVSPLMLAALLYLGAAAIISVFRALSLARGRQSAEARIRRSDIPALSGVIALGGVLGPVLMLFGLARISALTGSILLNLEAVFTSVLAVLVFHEHLDVSSMFASALIVVGAVLLSYQPGTVTGTYVGVLAIVAACFSWAVDNNLSQRLSLRDPVAIVQIKSACAGLTSLLLALATGHTFPAPMVLLGALALGCLSYGASLICAMLALRHLGAAREAAWFSTAPFIGAAMSIPIFGVLPTPLELIGVVLMLGGIFLLVRERHSHVHAHEALEHDHLHFHEEHHDHAHGGPVSEPHSHLHYHEPVNHEHPHVSDFHHRHLHSGTSAN